jgi:hypothetical protein
MSHPISKWWEQRMELHHYQKNHVTILALFHQLIMYRCHFCFLQFYINHNSIFTLWNKRCQHIVHWSRNSNTVRSSARVLSDVQQPVMVGVWTDQKLKNKNTLVSTFWGWHLDTKLVEWNGKEVQQMAFARNEVFLIFFSYQVLCPFSIRQYWCIWS